MKLIDQAALEEARSRPCCELCGQRRRNGGGFDAHHLMSKGAGRVDLKCNLAALCRVPCHYLVHTSPEAKLRVWEAVMRREGLSAEEIKEKVWAIRNLPKGSEVPNVG